MFSLCIVSLFISCASLCLCLSIYLSICPLSLSLSFYIFIAISIFIYHVPVSTIFFSLRYWFFWDFGIILHLYITFLFYCRRVFKYILSEDLSVLSLKATCSLFGLQSLRTKSVTFILGFGDANESHTNAKESIKPTNSYKRPWFWRPGRLYLVWEAFFNFFDEHLLPSIFNPTCF